MQPLGLETANGPDRRLVVVGLSGLLAGCLGGRTYRYRIGAEVSVAGRVIRGDAVREVYDRPGIRGTSGMDTGTTLSRGDAAMVDLGPRGILFLTLQGWAQGTPPAERYMSTETWTPLAPLARELGPDDWWRQDGQRVRLLDGEIPVMVTFGDLNDPRTVRVVNPEELAATFGPGVSLISVYVELTRRSVTRGIHRKLPWLTGGVTALSRKYGSSGDKMADRLYPWAFSSRNGNG